MLAASWRGSLSAIVVYSWVNIVMFSNWFVVFVACVCVSIVTFDLNAFAANPTLGQLDQYRKADLFALSAQFSISVSSSHRTSELKTTLV